MSHKFYGYLSIVTEHTIFIKYSKNIDIEYFVNIFKCRRNADMKNIFRKYLLHIYRNLFHTWIFTPEFSGTWIFCKTFTIYISKIFNEYCVWEDKKKVFGIFYKCAWPILKVILWTCPFISAAILGMHFLTSDASSVARVPRRGTKSPKSLASVGCRQTAKWSLGARRIFRDVCLIRACCNLNKQSQSISEDCAIDIVSRVRYNRYFAFSCGLARAPWNQSRCLLKRTYIIERP